MMWLGIVACVGIVAHLCWREHEESRELAVERERARITRWIRTQSELSRRIATSNRATKELLAREEYASAVLAETAEEIDALYHHVRLS